MKLALIITNILFTFFFSVNFLSRNFESIENFLVLSILAISLSIAYLIYNGTQLISFQFLTLCVSIIFSYTSIVFYLYYGEIFTLFWVVKIKSIDYLFQSFYLAGIGIHALCTGIISSNNTVVKKADKFRKNNNLLEFIYCQIGYYFSFLIIIFETLRGKGLQFGLAYSTYSTMIVEKELSLIYLVTINFTLPLFSIYKIVMSKSKKTYSINLFFFGLPAVILNALTGDRDNTVGLIIIYFIIGYIYQFYKFNNIKAFNLGLLLIGMITFIGLFRETKEIGRDPIENRFSSNNLFAKVIIAGVQQSSSLQVLTGTLQKVPSQENYRYGLDYLRSVLTSIPFVQGLLNLEFSKKFGKGDSRPTEWITNHYVPCKCWGLGYLIFAEMYLQFGLLGLIFLSLLMGRISVFAWTKLLQLNNTKTVIFLLFISLGWFGWIRNDVYVFMKYVTWGVIFIYLIPFFVFSQEFFKK